MIKFYLFVQDGCGPCHQVLETLKEVEGHESVINIVQAIVDGKVIDFAKKYNVKGTPTLVGVKETGEFSLTSDVVSMNDVFFRYLVHKHGPNKPLTKQPMPITGMTVFNPHPVETKNQPMFFGQPLGIQQYTSFKYPVFDKLTQTQLGFFWKPDEISLQKDRSDYQTLRPEQKHIFTSNLKYQVMLDSIQGRGPGMAFIPYCSLPELESAMTVWEMMEMIHSRSYTHIIKNLYPNPDDIFGTILSDKNIMDRAGNLTHAYDDFIRNAHQYGLGDWQHAMEGAGDFRMDRYELKRKLFRAMMNVNILEGIRFYVSFACSFAFGELKVMEGSAKIISLIARDENQHLVLTQNIINKWRDGDDPDMKKIYKEEMKNSRSMFEDAVNQEKIWAEYLFKDGTMIGLSDKLLSKYVEWLANRRMKAIGLKPLYDISDRNNPLPWTEHWIKSKGVQVAPQETEVESYIIGGIKQDIKNNDFSGFKL